jgi:SAM-dependent methyltransferase
VPTDHFAGEVADHYDESVAEMYLDSVVGPAVDTLAALAGSGPALELGIGTGRVALPLRERGVAVHGIDLSPDMVARLRAKPGGEELAVVVGDFATTRVAETFTVAYLVFNTLMNLTSQDAQVDCFRNAARHLRPGGYFVVGVSVPRLQGLPPGETLRVFSLTERHLGFDDYDVVAQGLTSHHYYLDGAGGVRTLAVPFRYVWPAELDLMARLAGMSLVSRHGGWSGEPFTAESTSHVSVWQRPAGSPAEYEVG